MKLYSVACEHVELFQIRVRAESEEDARRKAKECMYGHGVITEAPGYVGQTLRAGTVIEVEPE